LIVSKLRHWQLDLPLPADKVVKIPLMYRLPTQSKKKLPKGWVYVEDEAVAEVKEEVVDLLHYKHLALQLISNQSPQLHMDMPLPMQLKHKGMRLT
jgi:hypothetical protein